MLLQSVNKLVDCQWIRDNDPVLHFQPTKREDGDVCEGVCHCVRERGSERLCECVCEREMQDACVRVGEAETPRLETA